MRAAAATVPALAVSLVAQTALVPLGGRLLDIVFLLVRTMGTASHHVAPVDADHSAPSNGASLAGHHYSRTVVPWHLADILPVAREGASLAGHHCS